jgi:uncharacterized protein YijF (DUF1287 family)
MRRVGHILLLALVVISANACAHSNNNYSRPATARTVSISSHVVRQLVAAAIEQTNYTFSYDPSYTKINYPGGDVPLERGVCSDVIIRAFRKNGVDLQKEFHEDMARNFSAYPQRWGLKGPDSNIDHRRVPNLMTYFERKGKALPIDGEYLPGDIVAWQLDGGATHIGMMTNLLSDTDSGFLIVHNIGSGVRLDDALFAWRIIGHYRYFN